MRNDLMTLKEVCKETGVTRKIVQTYENYGLVKATTKNKYGYLDRKSTRLNSSHDRQSRMPSSA